MEILTNYRWPGNVRELENTIYWAMVSSDSDIIDISCLPENVREESVLEVDSQEIVQLSDIEKNAMVNALKATDCNITRAAKALNIGRNTLYRKIIRYQLNKIFPELGGISSHKILE